MTPNFLLYSRYYDLFYKDKNYAAEVQYVQNHLKPYVAPGAHLLELGCGTGRHAAYFCRAGYTVTGIDSSADMIAEANRKQIPAFRTVEGNITSFSVREQFDAAYSLFHVIGYLTSNTELAACFKKIYEHLKPGGVFCFDCWYGPAVLHELPDTRIKKLYDQDTELTRIAKPVIDIEKNVVHVHYDIRIENTATGEVHGLKEDHFMRYFTIPEIRWIAEQAGFTVLCTEEFMTSEKTTLSTWNLFVLLQKASL